MSYRSNQKATIILHQKLKRFLKSSAHLSTHLKQRDHIEIYWHLAMVHSMQDKSTKKRNLMDQASLLQRINPTLRDIGQMECWTDKDELSLPMVITTTAGSLETNMKGKEYCIPPVEGHSIKDAFTKDRSTVKALRPMQQAFGMKEIFTMAIALEKDSSTT